MKLQRLPSFEDGRGCITDLLGSVDAVTSIFTRKGAIRGNHLHRQTTQWTYVVSGLMETALGDERDTIGVGDFIEEPPGQPHAWRALSDCVVLVFTKGPRSGVNYESDVERLEAPLLW